MPGGFVAFVWEGHITPGNYVQVSSLCRSPGELRCMGFRCLGLGRYNCNSW